MKFFCFMEENFLSWDKLSGKNPDEWHGSASPPTDDIFKRPTSIGFDYQSGMFGFERDYIYSVTRWIAIKVGDRESRMSTDISDSELVLFQEAVPYYNYDCDAHNIPVLVVTEEQEASLSKRRRHWAVDPWGVRIGPSSVDHQGDVLFWVYGPDRDKILEEVSAFGKMPMDDEDAQEVWLSKRREVYLKYLKPEIDESVSLIRREIQRLDGLWNESSRPLIQRSER
jgi:hypothetical protein